MHLSEQYLKVVCQSLINDPDFQSELLNAFEEAVGKVITKFGVFEDESFTPDQAETIDDMVHLIIPEVMK